MFIAFIYYYYYHHGCYWSYYIYIHISLLPSLIISSLHLGCLAVRNLKASLGACTRWLMHCARILLQQAPGSHCCARAFTKPRSRPRTPAISSMSFQEPKANCQRFRLEQRPLSLAKWHIVAAGDPDAQPQRDKV